MRELTIRREACFWGKGKKDTVYIEDWESNDAAFGTTPCRRLGEIGNGETKTFSIGEKLARVYVARKKKIYDYCEIPSGDGDISLAGGHAFGDPAFRFHGELEPYPQEERNALRKGQKVQFLAKRGVLLIFLALAAVIVCNLLITGKDFTAGAFTITLTEDFTEESERGFELYAVSPEVLCCVEFLPFEAGADGKDLPVKDLAAQLIEGYGFENEVYVKSHGELTYFEAPNKIAGTEFHSFFFPMVTEKGVWILQFATHFTDAEAYREQIFAWAETVEIQP
ncbi:MAG: hypothetical protein E7651_06775 [Ruminococcaceae bacterium]|nr:hypothetical protein [Oscillospiraceae bacterium]